MGTSRSRLALLWLLLAVASAPAAAESAFSFDLGAASVQLIPPGPVPTDGRHVPLFVVVTDEDGRLAEDVDFSGTEVSHSYLDPECTRLQPGIFECDYGTPNWLPRDPGEVRLVVELPSGSRVESTSPLTFDNASHRNVDLETNPRRVRLGHHDEVELVYSVEDDRGRGIDGLRLVHHANIGRVSEVDSLGGGRYRAYFQPPAGKTPDVATIAVWDETSPDTPPDFFRLPLHGQVSFPIDVHSPDVRITFSVGDNTFPSVTSDETGSARAELNVAPGESVATVEIRQPDGSRATREADLDIPPPTRVALGGIPWELVADGVRNLPVYVMVWDHDGEPIAEEEKLEMDAAPGRVAALEFIGDGLYRAEIELPRQFDEDKLVVRVRTARDDGGSDEVRCGLIELGPAEILLRAERRTASSEQHIADLTVELLDASGRPDRGDFDVEFHSSRAPVTGSEQASEGVFVAEVEVDSGEVSLVQAVAGVVARRASPAHVVALPAFDSVARGGQLPVTVVTLDRAGRPVRGVDVEATVLRGGGRITQEVTTNANGLGALEFNAGSMPGLATIELRSGGVVSTVPILQTDEDLGAGFELPVGTCRPDDIVAATWRRLAASIVLGDEDWDYDGAAASLSRSAARRGGEGPGGDDRLRHGESGDGDGGRAARDKRESLGERRLANRRGCVWVGWMPGSYLLDNRPCDESHGGCSMAFDDEIAAEDFFPIRMSATTPQTFQVGAEWFPFQECSAQLIRHHFPRQIG